MKQSQRIFFPRTKLQNTNSRDAPGNGPVRVECSIMKIFMASATEAELGGLFENFQKATSMGTALADMGQLQPPTTVATYNTAANSIVNGTSKQKIS